MTRRLRQDLSGCFAERAGVGGVARHRFESAMSRAAAGLAMLKRCYDDGSMPLLRVPGERADLERLEAIAQRLACHRDVVCLGIGGSSLGARMLLASAPPSRPRVHFIENVDPQGFETRVAALDLADCALIVTSKSGGTAETLAGALALVPRVSAVIGEVELAERIVVVTEPDDNPLRRLGKRWGATIVDHHPGIGGRFSVLTATGMLPALIAGLDASAIRNGAADVLADALAGHAGDCPAAAGAAMQIALVETRGVTHSVMMPYVDRLEPFAQWYAQLWAESLGKDGKGTTPVRALGTVDQHSQLQLYLAGAGDKFFTIVTTAHTGRGERFPLHAPDRDLAWLAGRTMGDLMDASQRATAETLIRNGRPTRVITIDPLDEHGLGELIMHFLIETILAGHLLGVDPFGQPAVEEGKRLARRYVAELEGV